MEGVNTTDQEINEEGRVVILFQMEGVNTFKKYIAEARDSCNSLSNGGC